MRLPLFQSHRGVWRVGHQENTLPAFAQARTNGFEMIECDARLAADGRVVVIHDPDLSRIAGLDKVVAATTSVELKRAALVPSLEEVLTQPDGVPYFNIELKSNRWLRGKLEEAVARLIIELGLENRVIVSSFNPFSLRTMAKLLPEVPRGLLACVWKTKGNPIFLRKMLLARQARLHSLHLEEASILRTPLGRLFQKRHVPLVAWNIRKDSIARELREFGVDSMIVDLPTPLSL